MSNIANGRTFCHPATAVVLWLFFMVWVTWIGVFGLVVMTVLLLPGFARATRQQFIRYVRRSRWLLLILLLVHAYSLPGVPLWSQLGVYGPSQAGLYGGLIQTWRLLLILAALAILMTRLSRTSLLLGLYRLFEPLRYLGAKPERIAVRIWLTLGYAEGLIHETRGVTFRQRMEQLFSLPPVTQETMQPLILPEHVFSWIDLLCVLVALVLGIWLKAH